MSNIPSSEGGKNPKSQNQFLHYCEVHPDHHLTMDYAKITVTKSKSYALSGIQRIPFFSLPLSFLRVTKNAAFCRCFQKQICYELSLFCHVNLYFQYIFNLLFFKTTHTHTFNQTKKRNRPNFLKFTH